MFVLHYSWGSTDQQTGQSSSSSPSHHPHYLQHSDSAPAATLTRQPSCAIHSVSSFSAGGAVGGESMSDLIGGLLGRPGYSDTARSPPAKSPSGSKVSSRRESFMFFMGMSTDSGKSRTALYKLRFETGLSQQNTISHTASHHLIFNILHIFTKFC